MKYRITLEVESDWTLKQLVKEHHGALIFGANHSWKVLEGYKIEQEKNNESKRRTCTTK